MARTSEWADAARDPIAWFSALLRGIDRDDRPLVDRALSELAALGFRVQLTGPPPEGPDRGHNLIRIGFDPASRRWTATIDAGDFVRQAAADAPIAALLGLIGALVRTGAVDPDWRPGR